MRIVQRNTYSPLPKSSKSADVNELPEEPVCTPAHTMQHLLKSKSGSFTPLGEMANNSFFESIISTIVCASLNSSAFLCLPSLHFSQSSRESNGIT